MWSQVDAVLSLRLDMIYKMCFGCELSRSHYYFDKFDIGRSNGVYLGIDGNW